MPDIFISYSRKDSEQALALAGHLRVAGIDIWIDQQGIVGAEKWTTEIVEGIRRCSCFLLLLSPNSVASENVLRELLLASEKRKRILPIELRPTELPSSFEYPLAGLQRVQISDFEGIQKAIRTGVLRQAVTPNRPRRWKRSWTVALSIVVIGFAYYLFGPRPKWLVNTAQAEARKSLMVLPLEDVSPTHDSSWLADGIMTEMITSLSAVKGLQVIDLKTSLQYKDVKQSTADIASDLNVRYFVEGSIRRIGTSVKVSLQLVDQGAHRNLWSREFKSESNDILAMQETIGTSIAEGLKLNISDRDTKGVTERGQNPEAYSLYLKGLDVHESFLASDVQSALNYFTQAAALDSNFLDALAWKARCLAEIGIGDSTKSGEAEVLCLKILDRKPNYGMCYVALGYVYQGQGRMERAEQALRNAVRMEPDYYWSHYILAGYLLQQGMLAESEKEFLEAVRLNPEESYIRFALILLRHNIGDSAGTAYYVRAAQPTYERILRLRPNDEQLRVQYAAVLAYAGELAKSAEVLAPLETRKNEAPLTWYNMACVAVYLHREQSAFQWLNKMIDISQTQDTLATGVGPEFLRTDPDLVPLHDKPQWPGIVKRYEAKLHPVEHQKAKR